MRNEYIDIPAQPEPRRELLWRRQRLVKELARAATVLEAANRLYHDKINEIIELDVEIRDAS